MSGADASKESDLRSVASARAARRIILERRAAMLGSALVALSACRENTTPHGTSAPAPASGSVAGSPSQVVVPPASSSAEPEGSTPEPQASTAPSGGPTPRAPLPTIDIPRNATPEQRERYMDLREELRSVEAAYDRAHAVLPRGCRVLDRACHDRWLAFVDARQSADPPFGRYVIPPCPDASAETLALYEQEKKVRAYREARQAALGAELDKEIKPQDDAAQARLQEIESEWDTGHPRPCLSMVSCRR